VRAALVAGAACAGCGAEPPPPRWIELARGFEPSPLSDRVAAWERAEAPTGNEVREHPPSLELRHRYSSSDWRPGPRPGLHVLPLPGGAFRAGGLAPRLHGRGQEYPRATGAAAPGQVEGAGKGLRLVLAPEDGRPPPTVVVLERPGGAPLEIPIASTDWFVEDERPGSFRLDPPRTVSLERARLFAELVRVEEPRRLGPNEYRLEDEEITLCVPDGAPPAVELVAHLETGRNVDGQWQLRLGRFCATGIPVWSGEREELVTEIPPASALRFRFAHASVAEAGTVRLRVWLDDATIFDSTWDAGTWREARSCSAPLPAEGRASARLRLEVEGPPGLGALFTPVIGPTTPPRPDQRPWSTRPDLVVLLVDTLRADSLAMNGGDPSLAPGLNRFAETCLRFPAARASAAWTLPSISSMLTGLHPGQHGATEEDLTLAASHQTIAEVLAAAGYRTGAITDGTFFSPTFGLDQGFEWFAHHDPGSWDLDRTMSEAREFLALDDGRPAFLVVHTYRVHQPYRVGPDEDPTAYEHLMARARAEAGTDSPEALGLLAGYADELRALYHEGVRDLDQELGTFLADLEARRFFDHGALVLTSDHGESLGENQTFFHGGHLWETKLLVPLFLRAPDLEPRVSPHVASPIDLAPTLADLARLPIDPRWVGSSLLTLDRERPIFAFQLTQRSRQVACLVGAHKLIFTPAEERLRSGDCEEAFDLARDPDERENLAARAEWPAHMVQELADEIRAALAPRASASQASVSSELRQQLDAIGYGGSDD